MKNSHHGMFTRLFSSSVLATGNKTIAAGNKARMAGVAIWPFDMWKTRQASPARLMAPVSANVAATSAGVTNRAS